MKNLKHSLSVQPRGKSIASRLRGEPVEIDETQDERFTRIIRDGTAQDVRNAVLETRREISTHARMGRFTENSLQLAKEFNELSAVFLEKKLNLEKVENNIESLRTSGDDNDLNSAIQAALNLAIEKAQELKAACLSIPQRLIQLRERIENQLQKDQETEKGLKDTFERCLQHLPKLERGKVAATTAQQTATMNIEQRLSFYSRLIEQLAQRVPAIREVEVTRLLELTQDKYKYHDYNAALDCLKQVFQFDRKNIPAHRMRADIYKEMGNKVAYLCELRMIIKIDKADGFDFSRLADEILNGNGKPEEAFELLEQAVAKDPSPEYLEKLGDISCRIQTWFRAIQVYRQILQKTPNQPRIMHKLGRALLESQNEDEAFDILRTAIELQDTNSLSRVCVGRLYRKEISPVQAEGSFARAVELDDRNPDAYYWWGLMLFDRGDFIKAFKNAKQGVKYDPNRARNRLLLAKCCLAVGEPKNAIKSLEPCLTTPTPSVDVLLTFSEACRVADELKNALEVVGGFVKRFPHQPQIRADYGLLLLENGQPAEATPYFQPAGYSPAKKTSVPS